jgi:hypothetical protein
MKRLAQIISLFFFVTLSSIFASAENFVLPNAAGEFSIQRISDQEYGFSVTSNSINSKSTIFTESVVSPTRIVIDISPNFNLRKGLIKFPLQDQTIFSKVRVGTSDKRTRFVLDLTNMKTPIKNLKVNSNISGNTANFKIINSVVLVSASPTITAVSTSTPAPTLAPTQTSTATASPTPSPTATTNPTATPTTTPSSSPTPFSTVTSSPSPTPTSTPTSSPTPTKLPTVQVTTKLKNTLEKISFETSTNSLSVQFSNALNYQLTKSTPESYTLLFENVIIQDQNLLLEQFPPQGFLGFQAIAPKVQDKNLLIELYVEEGFQPEASWQNNILKLKAVQK